MTWNNQKTCNQRQSYTPPSREQVIAFLRDLAERNRRRPGATGLNEYGVMIRTAAELLENERG